MNEMTLFEKASISTDYFGFLAQYLNLNTQKVVHHISGKFIKFLLAHGVPIATLDQNVINIYFDQLRKSDIGNNTYNQNVSIIKSFLRYMGKDFDIKTTKVEAYGNVKMVSEIKFRRVMQYLAKQKEAPSHKQSKHLRDYIIFNLLFLTGLRKNEIIQLKHSSITTEGESHFYSTKTKGGKEIKKEFPPMLIAQIKRLKEIESRTDNDFIFTSQYTQNGNPLSNKALNCILNHYYQKVNDTEETVTVHSIRNLSSSVLHNQTKDIMVVKEHLNHSNLNTTYIYLSKLQNKNIDYYGKLSEVME